MFREGVVSGYPDGSFRPDGSVMRAEVLQSVHPMLDAAAREAALKCKFEPGKQRNIPVKAWMAIPFRFKLH